MNRTLIGAGIGVVIYIGSICSMENTCHRVRSDGNKYWDFSVLWTEGLVGPLRTTWIALTEANFGAAFKSFFNTWNPWFIVPLFALLGRYMPLYAQEPPALPSNYPPT